MFFFFSVWWFVLSHESELFPSIQHFEWIHLSWLVDYDGKITLNVRRPLKVINNYRLLKYISWEFANNAYWMRSEQLLYWISSISSVLQLHTNTKLSLFDQNMGSFELYPQLSTTQTELRIVNFFAVCVSFQIVVLKRSANALDQLFLLFEMNQVGTSKATAIAERCKRYQKCAPMRQGELRWIAMGIEREQQKTK